MLGDDGDATAAMRQLAAAEEAVDDAVRGLLDAAAVHWTGPAAAAYRLALEDAIDDVRRTRVRLGEAAGAVAEDAAARRAGAGSPGGDLRWLEPRWLFAPHLGGAPHAAATGSAGAGAGS